MNKKLLSVALLATLMATGCATIVKGRTQQVNLTSSNGQAVDVEVDGQKFQGPGVITLKKDGEEKLLKSTTPGCTENTVINSSVEPAFFGNILIGGLLGSTTDASTGSMWRYQDQVVVNCGAK